MREVIAISLPKQLKSRLDKFVKKRHVSRSDFIREAIQKQMLLDEFEGVRSKLVPQAKAQGIYTDEDVFRLIS